MKSRSFGGALRNAATSLLVAAVCAGGVSMLGAAPASADTGAASGRCSATWSQSLVVYGDFPTLTVTSDDPTNEYVAAIVDGHVVDRSILGYGLQGYVGNSFTWYENWWAMFPVMQEAGGGSTFGYRMYDAASTDNSNITDATPYDCEASTTVTGYPQNLWIDPIEDHQVGDAPFPVTASSTVGTPALSSLTGQVCAVDGDQVTVLHPGTCTVEADAAGDATYAAKTITTSFTVSQGTQNVAIDPIADHQVGDAPFPVTASNSSGLPVTLSSSTPAVCTVAGRTVTPVTAGSCTLSGYAAGDADYTPVSASRTFTVTAAAATLHLTGPTGLALSSGHASVTVTSSSPAPIILTSTTGTVCAVSGRTVTVRVAGTCTVRASQAADGGHQASTPVTMSFPVWAAPALPKKGVATQIVPVRGNGESALRVAVTGNCLVNGGTVILTNTGTCTVTVRTTSGTRVRSGSITVSLPVPGHKPVLGLNQSASEYFAFNSPVLTPAAKKSLTVAAPRLRSAAVLVIYGNTFGPGGNSPASFQLAGQRASAVATYLRGLGVKARIVTVPLAKLNPAGPKPALDRRTDVFYAPKPV